MRALLLSANLFSWVLQTLIVATAAALLPMIFRIRHPRSQLLYSHAVLAFCILLPFIQPWRAGPIHSFNAIPARLTLSILAAGFAVSLCLTLAGLWRIRRYRIASIPLYPIPDAMKAACAITHTDAVFCISQEALGPVMLGWLAPVVLLPESFLALGEEAQCGIACHELLHVRRGDWLVTLIEQFVSSLLWFNSGIWLLLSNARLAREQLVDAESVRLTAAPEPYIQALLAIARGHNSTDLSPAPLFLRRRHLTQRMHSLLSDTSASTPRLLGSYCSIGAILAVTVWSACAFFPMQGQARPPLPAAHLPAPVVLKALVTPPVAAVPALVARQTMPSLPVSDPWEPVTGAVHTPSTPEERIAALLLLDNAKQYSVRHQPSMPPYRFDISFTAAGDVADQGQGRLTETWMTGQKWRWTVSLGGIAHTRIQYLGRQFEDRHLDVIPMRAHMLRNEIFWTGFPFLREPQIRTANIQWRGKPATCLLGSSAEDAVADSEAPRATGRLWDEEEYCVDDASGVLVVHSIAPGTYAHFSYDADLKFHGRAMPDRMVIYVAGTLAVDASFHIADATAADEESLIPPPEMTTSPLPVVLVTPVHFRLSLPSNEQAPSAQPVIVHAELNGDGNVVEAEVSFGSGAAYLPSVLARIRAMNFGHTGSERQAYIVVRFGPPSQ